MKYLSLALLVILSACSSVKIENVDRDPAFSLSKYKTFGFHETNIEGSGVNPNYQANLALLKEAITRELEKKGVKRTQSSPEMAVNIGVAVDVKDQTRQTSFTNPGDRQMAYMGSRNYQWQSTEVVVNQYKEGAIKVDLVDLAGMKLVWTGTAQSVLPSNAKNVPKLIDEAVVKLFENL